MIWLKLAAVPTVVWIASWAGRRWGHKASGWISGLPMIAAPIMLFLALDQPREFVLPTAWITMTVAPAVGLHCLVFARLATLVARMRLRPALAWPLCLLSGWTAYYSSEKSRRELGISYRPLEETIEAGCRYYEERFLKG